MVESLGSGTTDSETGTEIHCVPGKDDVGSTLWLLWLISEVSKDRLSFSVGRLVEAETNPRV